jgi:hypothetical protein
MVPTAARPPRKRGQQIIPPAPVVTLVKAAPIIDLNSVVFEPALPQQPQCPVSVNDRKNGPSWRRLVIA